MSSSRVINDSKYDTALRKMRGRNPRLEDVASLLEKAHRAGDKRATYALATWYLHGRLYDTDPMKAVALLRDAADHDVPDALYDLAICFEQGHGVRRNPRKAVQFFLKAALNGELQSVYEVGRCYYHGIGVVADRTIARTWLDRARQLGITD